MKLSNIIAAIVIVSTGITTIAPQAIASPNTPIKVAPKVAPKPFMFTVRRMIDGPICYGPCKVTPYRVSSDRVRGLDGMSSDRGEVGIYCNITAWSPCTHLRPSSIVQVFEARQYANTVWMRVGFNRTIDGVTHGWVRYNEIDVTN